MSKFFVILSVIVSIIWLLIPQVVYAAAWLVARLFHHSLPWRPFAWAGMGLLCLWWAAFCYGNLFGRFRSEVKEMDYVNAALPAAFDGYRIVHISDLHLDGWRSHADRLQPILERIQSLSPDLIVFTGDLVSFDYRELAPFVPMLASLRARDGVVSILGNHDYSPYAPGLSPHERQMRVDSLADMQRRQLGWHLLLNEHFIVRRGTDSLAVIGVENQSCGAHQVIRRGNLHRAMQGTEGIFRILLSHDPSHWRAEVVGHTDIPLTLSGHTHAMQCRILGFTPSRWIYPECDGRYDEAAQTLYVNIGLGGTMPMRIGATPEITLIRLHPHI
ncbi:MAG: metallophosphoesterase [Bacteroidaceae bacterium]|nr:metallophosphoesterase [Bacteroidaceae bacterium]